jgi:hypothetical protein
LDINRTEKAKTAANPIPALFLVPAPVPEMIFLIHMFI